MGLTTKVLFGVSGPVSSFKRWQATSGLLMCLSVVLFMAFHFAVSSVWAATKKAEIVYTCNTWGYLEPCST